MSRLGAAILAMVLSGPAYGQGGEVPSTIHEVKAKHEARLLAMPGVVSLGVGRDHRGGAVIVIGLDRPRPETQAALPTSLEGYPVQVEIVGTLKAQ